MPPIRIGFGCDEFGAVFGCWRMDRLALEVGIRMAVWCWRLPRLVAT